MQVSHVLAVSGVEAGGVRRLYFGRPRFVEHHHDATVQRNGVHYVTIPEFIFGWPRRTAKAGVMATFHRERSDMHVGILRTDTVRPEWASTHGEYPDMFERLLSEEATDLRFTTWNVEIGELPLTVEAADAYLITGSKSSVYDDKAWIRALEEFVRALHANRHKLIGICFGHQLVAQALGGTVAKSPKGWGVGINCYEIDRSALDLADGGEVCLIASHQDQVVALPPGARQIARNDHCEFAGMAIGDHILTFQGHPEFTPAYSREIMHFRREMIGESRVVDGLQSLEDRQHEGARVARWMLQFMRRQ